LTFVQRGISLMMEKTVSSQN